MLTIWTVLIDFGLLVLIWLVQLIIYPSFRHISEADFREWHKRYSGLISVFVIPLMFSQVFFHGLALYEKASPFNVTSAVLIVVAWCTTFLLSVPCHNQLKEGGKRLDVIDRLIGTNWIRTVCWSLVFILSVLEFYT